MQPIEYFISMLLTNQITDTLWKADTQQIWFCTENVFKRLYLPASETPAKTSPEYCDFQTLGFIKYDKNISIFLIYYKTNLIPDNATKNAGLLLNIYIWILTSFLFCREMNTNHQITAVSFTSN